MQFEISVTLAVQSIGSWLNPLMSLFSFLGTEQFYLVLVPFIYWCIEPAFGLSIGAMLMLTNVVNSAFKLALHSPRPYWLDPQVKALGAESSFGMPSGHSQNAAAIWGLAAAKIKRNWAWVAAANHCVHDRFFTSVSGCAFPARRAERLADRRCFVMAFS
jgi:membrane-associated phospholipid phosphatase